MLRRSFLVSVALAITATLTGGCAPSGPDETPIPDAGTGPLRRVFVVNAGGTTLSVIDHDRREVIGEVEIGPEPHGQAPASTGETIYVTTENGDGDVVAIDTRTLDELWRIRVGGDLNQPALSRDDRLLFSPDLFGARTVVVDVEARRFVGEVEIRRLESGYGLWTLHNAAASHDGRHVYVTSILSNAIAQIDVATQTLTRIYDLSGPPRPIAIAPDDRTMYVQMSTLHGFVRLDLETGEETARIEWPETSERPDGYYDVILPTKCHGIGITPNGQELWAASNLEGNVRVYALPDLEPLATIPVGTMPNWVTFSSDGTTVYLTNADPAAPHGTVSVIDVATKTVVATLDVGAAPKRIHFVDVPAR